jgi:hypothetical protein
MSQEVVRKKRHGVIHARRLRPVGNEPRIQSAAFQLKKFVRVKSYCFGLHVKCMIRSFFEKFASRPLDKGGSN